MVDKKRVASPAEKRESAPARCEGQGLYRGGCNYEIKVEGHLDKHWSEWLGGLAITHEDEGYTRLAGAIPDQAALHGILVQIRDLGLPLIYMNRVENNKDQ